MQRKLLPMAAIAAGLMASPGLALAQTTSTAPATTPPASTTTAPTTPAAPPATAPATTAANPAPVVPPANDQVVDNNGGGGKWGLIGLIGLLGLSGLRPRRRIVTPVDTVVPGTGPGTTVGPGPRV